MRAPDWRFTNSLFVCAALASASASAQVSEPHGASQPAATDDDRRDGTIVRIDGARVYFDLKPGRAVAPGQAIDVLRTVTAVHPISGLLLADYFPLGRMVVESSGTVLSVGRVEWRISAQVKVGDAVRLLSSEDAAREPAPGASEDAGGLSAREMVARDSAAAGAPWGSSQLVASLALPSQLYVGDPLEAVVHIDYPGSAKSGQLHLHRVGDSTHHRVPLVDLFSYTRYGARWITHEWGFSLLSFASV